MYAVSNIVLKLGSHKDRKQIKSLCQQCINYLNGNLVETIRSDKLKNFTFIVVHLLRFSNSHLLSLCQPLFCMDNSLKLTRVADHQFKLL